MPIKINKVKKIMISFLCTKQNFAAFLSIHDMSYKYDNY